MRLVTAIAVADKKNMAEAFLEWLLLLDTTKHMKLEINNNTKHAVASSR
jgi:hypothetical protein